MQRRVDTTAPPQQASVAQQAASAMVNYRRIVCLALLVTATAAAPACDEKDHKLVYDQRQNGSENYRLSIDGVVIAVAPAESFLSALSDIDISDLIDLESLEQELKPKPPATEIHFEEPPKPSKPLDTLLGEKPSDVKPEVKPEEKPLDAKPEKPAEPEIATNIDDVSMDPAEKPKGPKRYSQLKRQESTQRLKHRLANLFLPFLRKRRHQ